MTDRSSRRRGPLAGRRAGATRRARTRLWGESWYFDFTDREGTLGAYVRLGLYPNLGVAWYWACLVGEGRPLVTVIDHDVALPKAPSLDIRADGLWADHAIETPFDHMTLGCESVARLPSTTRRRSTATFAATGCPSGSTSSGRPTGPACTRGSAPHGMRCPATSTARSSWATRRSPSTASGSATTAGACATGGARGGCGRQAGWTTARGSTRRGSGCPASRPSHPGTRSRPLVRWSRSACAQAEEELGEHGFPTAGRVQCGPRHGHRAALLQPRPPDRRRRHRHPARPLPARAVPVRDHGRPLRRRLDRVEPTGDLTSSEAIFRRGARTGPASHARRRLHHDRGRLPGGARARRRDHADVRRGANAGRRTGAAAAGARGGEGSPGRDTPHLQPTTSTSPSWRCSTPARRTYRSMRTTRPSGPTWCSASMSAVVHARGRGHQRDPPDTDQGPW